MPAQKPAAPSDEIRALYQGPLGEFTPGRQALAKRLQKAGDVHAGAVKELRKPSLSAWAVNQLFAREPQSMAALVEAGEKARAGQARAVARGDGSEVRGLLETIRSETARLAALATEIVTAAAGAPSAAVAERLRKNLDAIVLDPANAAVAARGWLDVDLEPPGFEVMAGLQVASEMGRGAKTEAPPVRSPGKAAGTRPTRSVPEKKDRPDRAAAERAAKERQERIERAKEELARLEKEATRLGQAGVEAGEAAIRAEREAVVAGKRAEELRRVAGEAKRRAEVAGAEVERARRGLRKAQEG